MLKLRIQTGFRPTKSTWHSPKASKTSNKEALYASWDAPSMACGNPGTHSTLNLMLITLRFDQSNIHYNLYIKVSTSTLYTLLIFYVDDRMLTWNNTIEIQKTEEALEERYKMSDLGKTKLYIGLQFAIYPCWASSSPFSLWTNLIKKFGPQQSNHCTTPMEESAHLHSRMDSEPVDVDIYQSLIGSLIFITYTRANLSYVVTILSKFMANPLQAHMSATKRVLWYLQRTIKMGILFPNQNNMQLRAFLDSDWACDVDGRKSTTGILIKQGYALITWKSKL